MTTQAGWDGRGLPPAAERRLAAARADGIPASLLSVAGGHTLASAGFTPVGEVLGCIVQHLGFSGWGGCGVYGGGPGGGWGLGTTITSGSARSTAFGGYRPYVDALYRGYDTALARLVAEARALGAHGVVGIRLDRRPADGAGNHEFLAIGTAVRGRGSDYAGTPFTTDAPGQQTAALLRSGWVPAALLVGISVAIRHDDYRTQRQASVWSGNTEVSGYTELINHVRADARAQCARRVARVGADGLVVSGMRLAVREVEPAENHRDHIAEATVTGTAIARFRTGGRPGRPSLTVLPLR